MDGQKEGKGKERKKVGTMERKKEKFTKGNREVSIEGKKEGRKGKKMGGRKENESKVTFNSWFPFVFISQVFH